MHVWKKKQTKETEKKKEKRMKNPREWKYTCTSSNNKRRAKTEKEQVIGEEDPAKNIILFM